MLPKNFMFNFPHLDVAGNVRATDDLVQVMAKAYDAVFPDLLGRQLVSLKSGVSPGAEKIRVKHYEALGSAEVVTDYSSYVPKVNLIETEDEYVIRGIADGYDFSIQDEFADGMSRVDTIGKKAVAARGAIERRIDELIFFGHPSGIVGLTNLANTNTHACSAVWSGVTWDVMLADLNNMVRKVQINTKYTEKANTLLMPPTLAAVARDKIIPDTGGISVLQRFMDENKDVTVKEVWRLETSGAASKPQIIAYDNNPEKIEAIVPLEFMQLPPQAAALVTKINCYARCGGIANYFPKSVLYGSGMVA